MLICILESPTRLKIAFSGLHLPPIYDSIHTLYVDLVGKQMVLRVPILQTSTDVDSTANLLWMSLSDRFWSLEALVFGAFQKGHQITWSIT